MRAKKREPETVRRGRTAPRRGDGDAAARARHAGAARRTRGARGERARGERMAARAADARAARGAAGGGRARGRGGRRRATTASADDGAARRARPVIALDGANIAWCYSAALHAAFGSKSKQPLSRGVVAALEHEAWARIDADVVAFVPSTYVEGPLHGLADGGSLGVVVPRHVRYLGNGTWRNERLFAEVRRGRVRLVERAGERSADDLTIIDYGRARDARIVSNDRYGDHKMGHGELKKYLKNHLFEYEFVFGTDAKRIREEIGDVANVEVGSAFLPPPPVDEGSETWDQSVHAEGSSRPWARYAKDALWGKQPRVKKRRSMGKVVRVQQASSDDLGFPFWAVDDAHIPVEFNPSCKF